MPTTTVRPTTTVADDGSHDDLDDRTGNDNDGTHHSTGDNDDGSHDGLDDRTNNSTDDDTDNSAGDNDGTHHNTGDNDDCGPVVRQLPRYPAGERSAFVPRVVAGLCVFRLPRLGLQLTLP